MFEPDPDFNRIKTALWGGMPDRIATAEITIDEGAKEAFLGQSVNDFDTDLEFYLKAGYDFITLGRRMAGFPPVWPAARLENYYETQRFIAHGSMSGVIKNRDDYQKYPWMKPDELDFRILDQAEGRLPTGFKVIRYVSPVFQMTWMLMGFENMSYALAEDPGLVEAVMNRIFEVVYREVEDAVERDCVGAIWFGDDIAIKDRLMISPRFLRRHFFPKLKMIADLCREKNLPLLYHTDGNVMKAMDDIIDSGVNALHPIDPTGMDIYRVKKEYGDRICLIGNVEVDLLLSGTPEEVVVETKRQLKHLSPGGGYVLGSSNSIPRTVKPENYRAMLETVREYGTSFGAAGN